ncbi:MAG: hypothetical protein ACREQV_08455, partial [Candidatus Binatia bacterium]
ESVLIRLAGLPNTLPVAELIERLDRLEGKSVSGAGKPGASRPSEKAAAAIPPEPVGTPAGSAGRVSAARSWPEFVAFVGKEKKFLASHLEAGKPLELPPGRMRIGVSERHHLAFLLDGDNLATLKEQANRFFAQDVNVQIVNMIADAVSSTAETVGGSAGDERSPMVKEALRIFGGSVRNVRKEN